MDISLPQLRRNQSESWARGMAKKRVGKKEEEPVGTKSFGQAQRGEGRPEGFLFFANSVFADPDRRWPLQAWLNRISASGFLCVLWASVVQFRLLN